MKILILNWRDTKHPDAGGSELHMQEIGSRWAKTGNQVSLYSSSFSGGLRQEEIDGVDIQRIGNKYTVYPSALRRLLSSQRKNQFDVIFESINTVPFFSPLFTRSPVVGQIYSLENKSVLLQEMSARMLPIASVAYALSSAIPAVYKNCEITTISNASKEVLVSRGFTSKKVHVAYPGMSDSWPSTLTLTPDIDRPNHSVVYLGRLKKYKGVQDILRALPLIKREIHDIKLRIIGKGDFEPTLRNMVDSLGIQDQVEFCGFVSEIEKARILKESSVYICTSRDEGGWTISAVEAMSAGVPLLVTKSQLDVLDGGKTGWLLENEDPALIAQKVIQMLQDRSLWASLSSSSLRYSKNFNWDGTASKTFEALKKAAAAQ
ncbi:MAG: glycosyltransferase family 4 protein [Thaumarchaeota archaeon]|nr:glycosyltransferase family 4 protein [Nitrososphaerota archaeon]